MTFPQVKQRIGIIIFEKKFLLPKKLQKFSFSVENRRNCETSTKTKNRAHFAIETQTDKTSSINIELKS
jgi:hypothetical protein